MLNALEAFDSYTFLIYMSENSNLNKIKYYKRKLSFIRDQIFESIKLGKLDYNSRFFDKNILSKFEEINNFGGILKFKERLLYWFISKVFNYSLSIDFDRLDYKLFCIRDLYFLSQDERFYINFYRLLAEYGVVIDYRIFRQKIGEYIDFFIKSYYGIGFFHEVYLVYELIKSELEEKGVEFFESGSIARFDKFIENICFIFPFNIDDPLKWTFETLKKLELYILKYEIEWFGDYSIFTFWISFCKVPIVFVFSKDHVIFNLYYLFSGRYLSFSEFKDEKGIIFSLIEEDVKKLLSKFRNYFSNLDDFYCYLGINPIPVELIDYPGIFKIAKDNDFKDLISIEDIKGDLHIHTTFSDGKNSVNEIISFAKLKGYEYIGISDHVDYLVDKIDEYGNLEFCDLVVFWGVEENIGPNGDLFSDSNEKSKNLIEKIDYINLSIHSDFNLSEQMNYRRVLNSLGKSKGLVFCHPTARVLGVRNPILISQEKMFEIFDYVNNNGKYVEINCHLDRLDLDYSLIISYRFLRNRELNVVINTDAHSLNQMNYINYGVKWARKAWCKKDNVLNSKKAEEVKKIIHNL
ncbi:MAG: PHP domain-containing protein [Candidatus Calescibacterium sp.]|nr:PHP domain-containing protein [Candidatus Calescibacterium sp.]MDW8132633.1 PHP domain-containing protein [Candidatus Calescibacterium sp.]